MRRFTLDNNAWRVTRQTLHMDQGVCYCPEFIATRSMANYPSRIAQVARAVWLGQLPASERGEQMVFSSILSGNGERWQNFGEDSSEYMLVTMLFRELFVQKGFHADAVAELKAHFDKNGGHSFASCDACSARWESSIPTCAESDTVLLLDDAVYALCSDTAYETGRFLSGKGICVQPDFGPYYDGLEHFAAGLVDDGLNALAALVDGLVKKNARRVITVSGRSQYMLTTFCKLMGIEHELRVVSILELADDMACSRAYILPGSFMSRYQKMLPLVEKLTVSDGEELNPNSREFLPLVRGGKRVNKPTMWLAPLCAAHVEFGADEALRASILEQGLAEIDRCGSGMVIAFDPFEYAALKSSRLASKTVFFTSVLK